MRRVLGKEFFNRSAVVVARELVGKFLVRRRGLRTDAFMIVETEAYEGPRDRASHASRGLTERNAPMFGPAGRWYVYLVYGMHWMLNVVTGPAGHPAAVLIRGLEAVSGPARLTRRLGISRTHDRSAAGWGSGLWIEDRGVRPPLSSVVRGPRVGVDYAGPVWSKKPYRFLLSKSVENTR